MVIKIKVRKTRKKMAKKDREHKGGWGTVKDCSMDMVILGHKDLKGATLDLLLELQCFLYALCSTLGSSRHDRSMLKNVWFWESMGFHCSLAVIIGMLIIPFAPYGCWLRCSIFNPCLAKKMWNWETRDFSQIPRPTYYLAWGLPKGTNNFNQRPSSQWSWGPSLGKILPNRPPAWERRLSYESADQLTKAVLPWVCMFSSIGWGQFGFSPLMLQATYLWIIGCCGKTTHIIKNAFWNFQKNI